MVECGPPIERVVLSKDGCDRQIEQFKRAIDDMGRNGIEVLCYNCMPQALYDAAGPKKPTGPQPR